MAIEFVREEESGTYTGHVHAHNGYYAGSFSTGMLVPFTSRRSTAGTSTPGSRQRSCSRARLGHRPSRRQQPDASSRTYSLRTLELLAV